MTGLGYTVPAVVSVAAVVAAELTVLRTGLFNSGRNRPERGDFRPSQANYERSLSALIKC